MSRNRRALRWLEAVLRHSRRFESLEVWPLQGPATAGRVVFCARHSSGRAWCRYVRPWQIAAAWRAVYGKEASR